MTLTCSFPFLPITETGQHITVYNNILLGPRTEWEIDGPEEMYVILLDNHRDRCSETERAKKSLILYPLAVLALMVARFIKALEGIPMVPLIRALLVL